MTALFRWLRWLVVWPDARPTDAPPRTWAGWLAATLQGLFGLSTWQRDDGARRGLFAWLLRSAYGVALRLVLLLGLGVLTLYLLIRGSLPDLDGTRVVAGLAGEVRIERDALGISTIHAGGRADLFRALGYLHGQERFFQMDLSRRYAAGELSALVGESALGADMHHRPLRLREAVRAMLDRLDTTQRAEIDAYVAGVNAGLGNLNARPVEYFLLSGSTLEPWTAEDTGLVLLSITLLLQADNWEIERYRDIAHARLPGPLFALLDARGTDWDAPLEGPAYEVPRLPTPEEFDLRREQPPPRPRGLRRPPIAAADALAEGVLGSNNWAVAGTLTRHGGAILACDMHLPLRAPNVWYRAGFVWKGHDGQERKAWGATYPGTPGLVVGSNQLVAWGLTNAQLDSSDLVRIERDPDSDARYKVPEGFEPFQEYEETITIRGRPARKITARWTRWGPLLPNDHDYALHWIAQQPGGLNLGWLDLLEARTLDEVLASANRVGVPHQNFVAVDRTGAIGWTILGRLPKRFGKDFDGRLPRSWADGTSGWDGLLPPEQNPRVVRPAGGRIWTANNRVGDAAAVARTGESGFDLGARAGQIRDGLKALDRPGEAEVFAIALDDRALFLKRWRDLLLKTLDKMQGVPADDLAWMRHHVETTADRAAADRIGYRLVLDFHTTVSGAVWGPLTARCEPGFDLRYFRQREGGLWKIVQERPVHLLDPAYNGDWDALLARAAEHVLTEAYKAPGGRDGFTWGAVNAGRVDHPLAEGVRKGVPYLGPWLASWMNMPARPLDGGSHHLPRVQSPWGHGASERMAVSPGREAEGYFHMPCGQSGHPLSPHYRDMHAAWQDGTPTPFLPGATVHTLALKP